MTKHNKYIRKPQNVRQVLAEQINLLRNKDKMTKLEIERARAIGYLCSITLSAISQGDLEDRLKALEENQ